MKKRILLLLLVLPFPFIQAQDKVPGRNFMAGVYATGGWNLPVRMTTKYITEDTSPWHGNQSWSAGAYVSLMVSEFYRIEIAPRYSWHKIGFELSPPIYNEKKIYTETFELVSIPVTFKRYLDKEFFISAGTIVDFSYKRKPEWTDPQSGFGLTLGAGREFRIKDIVIDVSPGVELHSVVPFSSVDNQQRLFVGALRIGISFNRGSAGKPEDDENKLNGLTIPEL